MAAIEELATGARAPLDLFKLSGAALLCSSWLLFLDLVKLCCRFRAVMESTGFKFTDD